MRLPRTLLPATAAVLAASTLGLAALHHTTAGDADAAASGKVSGARESAGSGANSVSASGPTTHGSGSPLPAPRTTVQQRPVLPAQLPGLGPKTLAEIPSNARQVVLATGAGKNSSTSQVVLWQRSDEGWTPGAAWAAHNGYKGWTDEHYAGDLRSPVGVFGLTDAGGRLADPGTKLPYTRSGAFSVGGTGFDGEPLSGAFDYVVAINYNRVPGTSPMDGTKPLGASRGGGIWIHVDHGGPTHACISLSKDHMRQLLRTLDPADHPVVVMGDARSLSR